MPAFGGVTGRVYCKAWRGPGPQGRGSGLPHGFGKHSGLRRLGNALNGAGIDCGRSTRSATGSPRATSGFGRAWFEFAKDKPLELLSGSNLLYLLKIHADMDAKIEPPEHWAEPSSDSRPPTVMNLRNPGSLRQAHLAQVTHRFLSRPTGMRCVVGSRFWRVAHSRRPVLIVNPGPGPQVRHLTTAVRRPGRIRGLSHGHGQA